MLLKLLGEKAKKAPLTAAVSVSAPLQLDICADAMNRGFSKFYQHILLKDLNLSLEKKFDKHDMKKFISIEKKDIKNLKTFWDFDEAYTAPVHGFKSAQDYYTKCSSRQFLKDIKIPTLIIHSKDDPFMTIDILPSQEELSKTIDFELCTHGGHVGFIGGTFFKPDYWLEKRVVTYFRSFV
jgi:predicted alpha/beta-fold hydrolase